MPVARVTGIALIGLGVACWPGPPLIGMLIYSALVTLYLAYLGTEGGLTAILLWPAVALHAILTVFRTSLVAWRAAKAPVTAYGRADLSPGQPSATDSKQTFGRDVLNITSRAPIVRLALATFGGWLRAPHKATRRT